jgi:hypothetical protein
MVVEEEVVVPWEDVSSCTVREDIDPTSSRVFSAIILWNPIPTPSITASKHAHPIAEFLAALYPPLMASAPPVKNPAITIHLSAPDITSQAPLRFTY